MTVCIPPWNTVAPQRLSKLTHPVSIVEKTKTDKIVEFLCSISNIVKVDYQVESKGIELDESNEKVMESFDFINNFIENTGDEKLIEIFKSLFENK